MKPAILSLILPLAATQAAGQEKIDWTEATQAEFERQMDSIFHRSSLVFMPDFNRPGKLNENDYARLAEELDIETAAIKAVVEIESGKAREGFTPSGKPLINFDLTLFKNRIAKEGISLASARKMAPAAFSPPDIMRYGSYQDAQHARFEAARTVSEKAAVESSFWGMFQIGGFNWKKCGLKSPEEFIELMSKSEHDQLRLFARFLENGGMLESIRDKNWREFARRYNGPGYRRHGYDRRLAAAYAKHKKEKK